VALAETSRMDILEMTKAEIPASWGRLVSAKRIPDEEIDGIILALHLWFEDAKGVLRFVQYLEDEGGKSVFQVHLFPRTSSK